MTPGVTVKKKTQRFGYLISIGINILKFFVIRNSQPHTNLNIGNLYFSLVYCIVQALLSVCTDWTTFKVNACSSDV